MFSMNSIVWTLPVMFLLHDFEEIILVGVWRQRYKKILDNLSIKKKPYNHFRNTDSFLMAIATLFLITVVSVIVSIITKKFYVWYGVFRIHSTFFIAYCSNS